MSEFKLNVSVKIGNTQLTARADEKDELEGNMAYLIETFGKELPQQEKSVLDQPSDSQICSIHKVAMKEREGKYGKFFSHYIGQYPDGSWCTGK